MIDNDDMDDGDDWVDESCKVCSGSGMEDDVCKCLECDGTGIAPAYW
jgi:DnaJ-class molecular chaperone